MTQTANARDATAHLGARLLREANLRTLLLPAACLLTTACTEVTWWDARGSWSGSATVPGAAAAEHSSNVSDPFAGPSEDRVELCELSTMDVGLSFVPIQLDHVAAVEIQTARPLCEEGSTQITGGSVLVWAHAGGDPNVLGAVRSSAWTVTGEITITSYTSFPLPDLDAGDEATTEQISGTIDLTATGPGGAVVRIDGAAFQLTVTASRIKRSIS